MRALAVDVGGSHVSCAAVEDDYLLKVIHVESDSQGTLANLLPVLAGHLRSMANTDKAEFNGVAFGFCGLVDTKAGRIVSTNRKYPDATEIDLVAWAREELGMRIVIENDARLALLGEQYCGAAQGLGDAVMMTLGTGIGTAVITEGRLLRGRHFQAGCLGGHFTVALDGRRCSCGALGCFEAESSTYALPDLCRSWPGFTKSCLAAEARLDFERLFSCADNEDHVAQEIRSRCIHIWTACALSLVHAYDPEVLIVGGGVMQSSYPILRAIENHLERYAWTPWGKVRVLKAALGSSAALLGAVPLLQERS